MKKVLIIVFVLLMAQTSFAQGLAGSAHDFTDLAGFNLDAWNTPTATNKMCGPCHTPHNGYIVADAPLWAHAQSGAGVYTMYTGAGTMDAAVPADPQGISLLCLSCHDGAISLDNFIPENGAGITLTGDPADLTLDLSDDHPISIQYDNPLFVLDDGLYDPEVTLSGLGLNIDDDMLFGAGKDQLECASCHDVHNKLGLASLMLKTNTNSELCLTCHNK